MGHDADRPTRERPDRVSHSGMRVLAPGDNSLHVTSGTLCWCRGFCCGEGTPVRYEHVGLRRGATTVAAAR